jgi:SPP1 gp7 family putative phage head morphogenesis protein
MITAASKRAAERPDPPGQISGEYEGLVPLNEWQKRLRVTRHPPEVKRSLVQVENEVVRHHTRKRDEFIEDVIQLWKEKGRLSLEDLSRAISGHAGDVADAITKPIEGMHEILWEYGQGEAVRFADPSVCIQRGRTARFRKRAQLDPQDRVRVQDAVSQAFTKIKTVGPDQIQKIREELSVGGGTADITLRVLQKDYYETPEMTEQQFRDRLGYTWDKLRPVYQRIVRTESMNVYTRAQLEEWRERGYTQVTRHAISDIKTCQKCKQLALPPNNVYEISELLTREYPLTEDSHPNCRCEFQPIINWDAVRDVERQMFAKDPPETWSASTNITVPEATATNVPVEFAQGVDNLLRRSVPKNVPVTHFTPEVTADPMWQQERLKFYTDQGLDLSQAERQMKADAESLQGLITSHTLEDGTMLVSRWSADVGPAQGQLAREDGFRQWEALSADEKKWWEERFNEKKQEQGFVLGIEGVQLFGGTAFASPMGEESPRAYYSDCYQLYIIEPIRLYYLDNQAYNRMLDRHFMGRSFFDLGGVR